MINIITKECDFEIANLQHKKINNTVGNNNVCLRTKRFETQVYFLINSYISFIKIKNLKRTYLA